MMLKLDRSDRTQQRLANISFRLIRLTRGDVPEASTLSCCRRAERRRRGWEPGARTEPAPGGGGRLGVPSDPGAGAEGSPTKKRRERATFEGRWRRKMEEGRWRAAWRTRGHWQSAGNEPCRVCEEGGE